MNTTIPAQTAERLPQNEPRTPLQAFIRPQSSDGLDCQPQHDIDESNRLKLEALISLFGISLSDIARTAGVSCPLVSRILSRDNGVNANTLFSRLENKLPELIANKRVGFFQVQSVPLQEVKEAVENIKRVA